MGTCVGGGVGVGVEVQCLSCGLSADERTCVYAIGVSMTEVADGKVFS